MSLIELRDIGKIYVSENSVAVGIRGVNAKMDIGEFIAITGASGSGKTTLLNVISGMDSYEEGEMLVCGEPTSHYIQSDWEEYREKYISFIFQDYNIIDSFTVLQNVELALSHIASRKERRKRAEYLINKVGLTAHKNHKGSKLSGGQKQRTVIARALAKDSPIILADEPTGNLDSKSAAEIIALLKEISTEKLVVVVTHSFDEVKDAATRELRIFNGALERDTEMHPAEKKEISSVKKAEEKKERFAVLRKGFELGAHRFTAKPKLAAFMSIIMTLAILGTFFVTSMFVGEPLIETDYIFTPMEGRVAITRVDGKAITEEEIKALAEKYSAESYLSFDMMLESYIRINRFDKDYGFVSIKYRYGTEDCNPSIGRLPEKGEAYLIAPISWQPYLGKTELMLDSVSTREGKKYKISGVEYYYDNTREPELALRTDDFAAMSASSLLIKNNVMIEIQAEAKLNSNDISYLYNYELFVNEELNGKEVVWVDYDLKFAEAISNISFSFADYSYMSEMKTIELDAEVNVEKSLEESRKYINGTNSEFQYGLNVSPEYAADIISQVISSSYPQGSLFFKNDAEAKKASEEIRGEEYFALTTDVSYFDVSTKILNIVGAFFLAITWLGLVIFLAFFLALCMSRNVSTLKKDVGILRSMGIKNNVIRVSMYAIMAYAMIPAVIFFAITAIVIYTTPSLNSMFPFLHAHHYIIILIGTVIIEFRLAGRNNKKIFKQSVRKTLRGGNAE